MSTRKTLVSALRFVAPVVLLLLLASHSFGGELIFSQSIDGLSTYGPSNRAPGGPVQAEVADDFNLFASVERIVVFGSQWGPTDDFAGAYVRFYAYGADGKPGDLQSESFLAAGDPGLVNGLDEGGWLDITLPTPFSATGQHFVAVQPMLTTRGTAGAPTPTRPTASRSTTVIRATARPTGSTATGWIPSRTRTSTFQLYGTMTGAGHIDSLSAPTLPRSGYLEIFGSNFGGSGRSRSMASRLRRELERQPRHRLRAGSRRADLGRRAVTQLLGPALELRPLERHQP